MGQSGKEIQCKGCVHAGPQGSVGRALGLPLPPGGYVCHSLDTVQETVVVSTLLGVLSVLATRNECPNFAAPECGADAYRSEDLP